MIKQAPAEERPRERLQRVGAEGLSLRELIAVVLGAGPRGRGCLGVAADILARGGQTTEDADERAFFLGLELSPSAHLNSIKGLGPVGRARLAAAFELGRRYVRCQAASTREVPRASLGTLRRRALKRVPMDLRVCRREWLGFVPLDVAGRAGDFCLVERGARTHVNVDARELFARILAVRPASVLLVHNHPSGDLTPSVPDRELTERVGFLLDALGVGLLDHCIVAGGGVRCLGA